jgi:hypothetical protein
MDETQLAGHPRNRIHIAPLRLFSGEPPVQPYFRVEPRSGQQVRTFAEADQNQLSVLALVCAGELGLTLSEKAQEQTPNQLPAQGGAFQIEGQQARQRLFFRDIQ